MSNTNIMILNTLKEYIQKVKEEKLFMSNKSHFTVQDSKMHFERLVAFILNLPKKSLSVELVEFFNSIGKPELTCTKSAFTQQRSKLNYAFFASLSSILVEAYYKQNQKKIKRWNGFILCGVDGSTISLVNNPDVIDYFGCQANQYTDIPMGRMMGIYDVLNNVSLACNLFPIAVGEQTVIKQWIEAFQGDHLFLYDRAFPGFVTQFLHQQQEQTIHYVMRSKVSMNWTVSSFVKSNAQSSILTFQADHNHVRELNELGYRIKAGTELKVRAVKVRLKNGETEVLLTNLFDKEKYPATVFKELYFKRWGIETNYNAQKNYLQIESFSGTKVNSILQDFYSSVLVGNLQSILSQSFEEKIAKQTKHRRHRYKVNRNVAIGLMKNRIPNLFLHENPEKVLKELLLLQAQYYEPVRKGRSFIRKKISRSLLGKYQTVTNYKRVL